MNAEDRAKQQRMIVNNLKGVEFAVAGIAKEKDSFRKATIDLATNGGSMYAPEYVEQQIGQLQEDFTARMQTACENIIKRLEELRTLLEERNDALDLTRPELNSALKLIGMSKSNLTFETAKKINANFLNDQASLAALRIAYESCNLHNAGGIDAMIYDPEEAIDRLEESAKGDIAYEGSINHFATQVAKIAALEGVDIDKLPDPDGAVASMRAAAGLPVPGKTSKQTLPATSDTEAWNLRAAAGLPYNAEEK